MPDYLPRYSSRSGKLEIRISFAARLAVADVLRGRMNFHKS